MEKLHGPDWNDSKTGDRVTDTSEFEKFLTSLDKWETDNPRADAGSAGPVEDGWKTKASDVRGRNSDGSYGLKTVVSQQTAGVTISAILGYVWTPKLIRSSFKKCPIAGPPKEWQVGPNQYVLGWMLDHVRYPPVPGCFKVKTKYTQKDQHSHEKARSDAEEFRGQTSDIFSRLAGKRPLCSHDVGATCEVGPMPKRLKQSQIEVTQASLDVKPAQAACNDGTNVDSDEEDAGQYSRPGEFDYKKCKRSAETLGFLICLKFEGRRIS